MSRAVNDQNSVFRTGGYGLNVAEDSQVSVEPMQRKRVGTTCFAQRKIACQVRTESTPEHFGRIQV